MQRQALTGIVAEGKPQNGAGDGPLEGRQENGNWVTFVGPKKRGDRETELSTRVYTRWWLLIQWTPRGESLVDIIVANQKSVHGPLGTTFQPSKPNILAGNAGRVTFLNGLKKAIDQLDRPKLMYPVLPA
jgi:hypothetical protein